MRCSTNRFGRPRLLAQLLGAFAGLALLLAVSAPTVSSSFMVAERRREIGIRVAIGATRGSIVALVTKQGLRIVSIGLAVGLAGALALNHLIASLLFGVEPTDPATLAAVVNDCARRRTGVRTPGVARLAGRSERLRRLFPLALVVLAASCRPATQPTTQPTPVPSTNARLFLPDGFGATGFSHQGVGRPADMAALTRRATASLTSKLRGPARRPAAEQFEGRGRGARRERRRRLIKNEGFRAYEDSGDDNRRTGPRRSSRTTWTSTAAKVYLGDAGGLARWCR